VDEKYRLWGAKISKPELGDLPPGAILARCLFGEARGASLDNKQKVGCVIRNRVHWHLKAPVGNAGWASVILKPFQFSWTMDSDPNLPKVLDPLNYEAEVVWDVCCKVSEMIVSGASADTTQGSDHYYDKSMDSKPPPWATGDGMTPTVQTDRFRFFRSARVKQWVA